MLSQDDTVIRLVVAALLGSLVGFERERLLWSAGIRTHMLVCVGACLFMIVSAYGFTNATKMPHVDLDPSRVAAQVVSGVGFLGAGSILLRGNSVRGMTTAASIWTVAALGLASGSGMFFAAFVSTGIVLLILAGLKPLEEAYRARIQSCVFHMRSEPGAVPFDDVKKALRVRGGQVKRVNVTTAADGFEDTTIHLARVSQADIRAGAMRLKEVPGVLSVKVSRKLSEIAAALAHTDSDS